MDRAVASEATGREFESLRAHHFAFLIKEVEIPRTITLWISPAGSPLQPDCALCDPEREPGRLLSANWPGTEKEILVHGLKRIGIAGGKGFSVPVEDRVFSAGDIFFKIEKAVGLHFQHSNKRAFFIARVMMFAGSVVTPFSGDQGRALHQRR